MDSKDLANLIFPDVKDTSYYEEKYPDRNLPEGAVVTRYAPSPTGFVHIGGLYQSLVAKKIAKQTGGVFFVRIEDTDQKREVENGVNQILDALEDYDLSPDETIGKGEYAPYLQSQRKEIYQAYAKKLIEEGKAYPCFCTPEELDKIRENQEKAKERTGYFGKWAKCRNMPIDMAYDRIKNGDTCIIRLKSPGNPDKKIKHKDVIKGNIDFPENDQDIVIIKSDGLPTYHFAHAVDDHLMHTTHVIRGDEWVSSIPKHVQLFKILGFKRPEYAHIAPITIKDQETGAIRKLSKRKDPWAGAIYYEEKGIPFDALHLYLATITNSNFEEWYLQNSEKDISEFEFSFSKHAVGGSSFDNDKLTNICKTYFSRKSGEEVYEETLAWAEKHDKDYAKLLKENSEDMKKFLDIEKEGPRPRKDIGMYSEVKEEFSYAIDSMFKDENYSKNESEKEYDIDLVLDYINNHLDLDVNNEEWFNGVREFATNNGYAASPKEYKNNPDDYKGHVGDICEAIRVMITGRLKSPDLFSIMKILGKDRIVERVNLYKEFISK